MCEFCKAEVNERNAVINESRDKMSLDKDNELEIVVNVNPRALYDYFSILYCPLCGKKLEGRLMKYKITYLSQEVYEVEAENEEEAIRIAEFNPMYRPDANIKLIKDENSLDCELMKEVSK